MSMARIRAQYYQQFDADPGLDVPGEGYGGWKCADLDLDLSRTALVVMHAWSTGTPGDFAGWRRAVEYIPRAEAICRDVFPALLEAARQSGLKVLHVVGGGDYYRHLDGYRATVEISGSAPPAPEPVPGDVCLRRLHEFRAANVFVGAHNAADVKRGFDAVDFPEPARPHPGELIAENGHQLAAICRRDGLNHLVYVGFAINWCLLLSPGGMADMTRYGVMCSSIREAVTAVENRESARNELHKEEGLWRVALAYGFVFELDDFVRPLRELAARGS